MTEEVKKVLDEMSPDTVGVNLRNIVQQMSMRHLIIRMKDEGLEIRDDEEKRKLEIAIRIAIAVCKLHLQNELK
ncbi:MAG: hypothetical protein LBB79_00590 [Prevotellaceae bacterium]|jgi:hypothetical protein|nr:hypothetical protein [Prevotellaceae bacterium]